MVIIPRSWWPIRSHCLHFTMMTKEEKSALGRQGRRNLCYHKWVWYTGNSKVSSPEDTIMRGCQLVNLFQNVVCFQRNIPRTLNPSSMNYFRGRCHNCSYLKEQTQATEQQWGRTYYTVLLQSHMHSSMKSFIALLLLYVLDPEVSIAARAFCASMFLISFFL